MHSSCHLRYARYAIPEAKIGIKVRKIRRIRNGFRRNETRYFIYSSTPRIASANGKIIAQSKVRSRARELLDPDYLDHGVNFFLKLTVSITHE
jgi:hypothetical protein